MVLMKFRRGLKKFARRIAVSPRTGTVRLRLGRGRRVAFRRYQTQPGELKFAMNNGPVTAYNAAATVFGDIIRTIPTVSAGDGANNREGRKIKLYQHSMKGTIRIAGAQVPQYANIWCVEDKWMKDFSNVDAAEAFNVMLDEGGIAFSPLGNWQENGYPLNRDRFIIRKKRVKLSYAGGPGSGSGNPEDPTSGPMATFSFVRNFKSGRTLTYAGPTSTIPENYNCYMFISLQLFDETSGSLTATTVRAQTTSMFKFKD